MLPTWTREATPSIRSGASRASSIISTHTKTSITTVQDDSSDIIDVPVGHLIYRLRSDGHILSVTYDLPPPPFEPGTYGRGENLPEAIITSPSPESNSMVPGTTVVEHLDQSLALTGTDQSSSSLSGVSRNRSFTPGKESISVGRRVSVGRRRTSSSDFSQTHTPQTDSSSGTPATNLRRRNGVKLKLVTRSGGRISCSSSPASSANTPTSSFSRSGHHASSAHSFSSAEPVQEPGSPAYIGRGATGTFPSSSSTDDTGPHEIGDKAALSSPLSQDPSETERHISITQPSDASTTNLPGPVGQQYKESTSTSRMDNEREIANHYRELVRVLDEKHNREIAARDREIAETREMMRALTKEAFELKMKLAGTNDGRSRDQRPSQEPDTRDCVITENRKMIHALLEENYGLRADLDKTKGKNNETRDCVIAENRKMINVLLQENEELRTDLDIANGGARVEGTSNPRRVESGTPTLVESGLYPSPGPGAKHLRQEGRPSSYEDIPLPPLKRSHIRTLKNSMKRRAERLKNRGTTPDPRDQTYATGIPLKEEHQVINVSSTKNAYKEGRRHDPFNVAKFPTRSDLDSWDEAMLQNETHWYTHHLMRNLEHASGLLDQRRQIWRRKFMTLELTMRRYLEQNGGDEWRHNLISLERRVKDISAQESKCDRELIAEIKAADRVLEENFRARWGDRAEQVGVIVQMRLSLFGRKLAIGIKDNDDHDSDDDNQDNENNQNHDNVNNGSDNEADPSSSASVRALFSASIAHAEGPFQDVNRRDQPDTLHTLATPPHSNSVIGISNRNDTTIALQVECLHRILNLSSEDADEHATTIRILKGASDFLDLCRRDHDPGMLPWDGFKLPVPQGKFLKNLIRERMLRLAIDEQMAPFEDSGYTNKVFRQTDLSKKNVESRDTTIRDLTLAKALLDQCHAQYLLPYHPITDSGEIKFPPKEPPNQRAPKNFPGEIRLAAQDWTPNFFRASKFSKMEPEEAAESSTGNGSADGEETPHLRGSLSATGNEDTDGSLKLGPDVLSDLPPAPSRLW